MTTQTAAMPLHHFSSPNGQGLCTYESAGKVCGGQRIAFIHLLPPKQTGLTVEEVQAIVPKDRVSVYLDEKASAAYETYHGVTFPVDDPPTTAQVVAMFHDHALRLAVAKNQAYADAWRKQGYMGNVGRVLSKVARLREMVWRDETIDEAVERVGQEESLRDTLLDMANLCAFAAHNLTEGNRWGKP